MSSRESKLNITPNLGPPLEPAEDSSETPGNVEIQFSLTGVETLETIKQSLKVINETAKSSEFQIIASFVIQKMIYFGWIHHVFNADENHSYAIAEAVHQHLTPATPETLDFFKTVFQDTNRKPHTRILSAYMIMGLTSKFRFLMSLNPTLDTVDVDQIKTIPGYPFPVSSSISQKLRDTIVRWWGL
jgi:hypothetical protein